MDKSLFRYIWKYTHLQQLWILLVVLASMIPFYISFAVPKLIINGPVLGKGFDSGAATQTYFKLAYDVPWLGHIELFSGFQLGRFAALGILCGFFLLLVIVNGGFKFYINTYKGRLGERMLRRIRFELVDRVLRFPPAQFKRLKPAEIATMVKDEVEPLGGFIGDAFVQPALLGGQALTAMVFIVVQDWWLGSIALVIVVLQLAIIPRMRRRLVRLGRERQLTARELSGRIGEISEGISVVHTHDTSNYVRADISERLGRIFKIRYDLYQWKFMVKFLNNFLAQVTPFLFYVIGGYQAIKGHLDVGQLVAVIAAYKDLPGPLKELIDWDQSRQDVAVKYAQVYEQFDIEGMIAPEIQLMQTDPPEQLALPLKASNLFLTDDSGANLLEPTTLEINPGELVAIVGTTGGGGEALAEAFAGLIWPSSGQITIGPHNLSNLPESVTGRRLSYAGSDAFLFHGNLSDNLLYGLKHAPLKSRVYGGNMATHRKWQIHEARKSGNTEIDINGDWIDYEAAGVSGPGDLFTSVMNVLDTVQLLDDVFNLGLRATTSTDRQPELADRIVEVRKAFRSRLELDDLGDLVVPFESGGYNLEATVIENLLFGAASGPSLSDGALAENPYVQSLLTASGLEEPLYKMGIEIASNVVELFRDLPSNHPFFQQLILMTAEEIPNFQALLGKLQNRSIEEASREERAKFITLSFAYVEPRQRFDVLDQGLMTRIVDAREAFAENLPPELKGRIERYDLEQFNTAASIMDNVLLGRISHQYADAAEKIRAIVRSVINDLGLQRNLISIGLEFDAGVGGKRLTVGQRQKLNLARALLKRPDFLILNRSLSALDQQTQRRILVNILDGVKEASSRPTIICVLANPRHADLFDRVIIFDRGILVADGTYQALLTNNDVFKGLIS